MQLIDKWVRYMLFFMMTIILFLLLTSGLDYLGKNEYLQPNIVLLVCDIIVFFLILGGGYCTEKI